MAGGGTAFQKPVKRLESTRAEGPSCFLFFTDLTTYRFSPGAGGCLSPSRPLSATPGPEPRPAPRTAPGAWQSGFHHHGSRSCARKTTHSPTTGLPPTPHLRPGDLYRTFPGGPGPAFSCGLWLSCSWPRGSFRQQACAGRRQSWGAGLLRGQQSGGEGRQEPRDTGGTVVWLLLSCEVPPRSNRHPSR
ncbi:uncharacterized protein LOC120244727 isoform X3 [Hyaena hyaena]|uniref:uncharacterized protein LOC120244727 isoform X3 n=1 Tax=Hyaena hyaena TaxID=95912 RepID=UPI00192446B3|nr:uncharacterized protein LOC120244727 isoform X3 [Hyaena hyaena]